MFEKLKSFRLINRVVQERETRDRKMAEKGAGVRVENRSSTHAKNIPTPWKRREWSKTRNIADLPSVVGNILVSGPTKTMYGAVTDEPILNPKLFEDLQSPKGLRERSTRRARKGESDIAIDSVKRGIGRDITRPPRSKTQVRAASNRSRDPEQVSLDDHQKVRGFHASQMAAIDDNVTSRFFGLSSGETDLIKWAFGKVHSFWNQTVFGQMLHQVRPDVLGRLIESKNRPVGNAYERRGMSTERIESPSRRGY